MWRAWTLVFSIAVTGLAEDARLRQIRAILEPMRGRPLRRIGLRGATQAFITVKPLQRLLWIHLDTMKVMASITSDPAIMMGKPVVAATRITVELILQKLAAGETTGQILAAHPYLTEEGIRTALAFAVEALRADVVYPIETIAS